MTDQAAIEPLNHDPLMDDAELEAIITEVLDALLMSAELDVDAPMPSEPGIDETPLHGVIVIHADTEAKLVIESDAQACARLARCWGLVGPDGAEMADAQDALGELCNLVGATVKTVFDEESSVDIPEVSEAPAPDWYPEQVEIFHTAGHFVARFGLI